MQAVGAPGQAGNGHIVGDAELLGHFLKIVHVLGGQNGVVLQMNITDKAVSKWERGVSLR